MYFTSRAHRENYMTVQNKFNIHPKGYEYLSAAYILAYPDIYSNIEWSPEVNLAAPFEDQTVFNFPGFSGSTRHLVLMAESLLNRSLFNIGQAMDRLDDEQYQVAIQAIEIRRGLQDKSKINMETVNGIEFALKCVMTTTEKAAVRVLSLSMARDYASMKNLPIDHAINDEWFMVEDDKE